MTRILLGVSASAAIYKACDLGSKLRQGGHEVRTVLTNRAAQLISPQLFEAVTGQPAASTEWGPERRAGMDHIDLARWAETLLIAPCSANTLARLAHGAADDLLSTVALAVQEGVPRWLCPAMNPAMFAQASVQRNLGILSEDGWQVISPEAGELACGEAGVGRLAEPASIVRQLFGGA